MRRLKLKLVLLSVVLMVTATVNVHAEDWKGIDITDLSVTGDGYFEAPISQNALENGLNGWNLYVFGSGFTLTSVDLIKSDGTTVHLLQNLNVKFENWEWDKRQLIPKDQFQKGDVVRCYFKDKVTSGDKAYNPKFFRIKEDGSGSDDITEVQNNIYRDGVARNEVYLYNVNTGKFLYIGGYWGVHGELLYRDFGLKFKVEKKTIEGTNGPLERYLFSSDVSTESSTTKGNHLGLMKGYQGDDQMYNDGIVVDMNPAVLASKDKSKPMYSYCYFNVVPVSGGTDGTYTYTLSLKPRELSKDSYALAAGSKDQWDYMGTETYYLSYDGLKVVESTTSAGQWRFVPVSEIDEAVRNNALSVDAFSGMNLDITYKIDNQGFNRNNENHWTGINAEYVKYVKKTTNQALYNLYNLYDQKKYGKYYYGLLSSGSNDGYVYRSFFAPASGWYKVQCQGVSKSGNGQLFAKAGTEETPAVYAPLNKVDTVLTYNEIVSDAHKQDRVNLGKDFYDNKYHAEVFVYAKEGDYVMLGVQQWGNYDTANDLTAFDDFQIKYLGEIFVLDENYDECTDDNGYTTGTGEYGATVILRRTFSKKDDGTYYWNTLTLPISLTGVQVKSAFGENVKLAKASGLDSDDPYIITFDTENADNGIEAGQFYLIQPAKEPGQSIKFADKTLSGPLYTLGRRVVETISGEDFKDNGWNHPTHNSIRYHGTYLKKDGGVPGGSYVFSKGNMYHTKTAQTIKGFRFWIEDEEPNPNGQAKPFTLSISGVEDQQESQQIITSISEVETVTEDNAAVYSLSGQFLGKGKQLLNSLPKGIYVVNNKKYMVK